MKATINTTNPTMAVKEIAKVQGEVVELGTVSVLTHGAGYGEVEWTGSRISHWL